MMSKTGDLYKNIGRLVISKEEIQDAIKKIAKQLNRDYRDREIVIVSNLKGSFRFVSDLVGLLKMPVRLDFISFRSYRGIKRVGNKVRVEKDLDIDITNSHVLLVEDIVDTGLTLDYIAKYFKELKKPASIKTCTLLDKVEKRQVKVTVDYSCFKVPDLFLIGYGLDHEEYFRELNDIMEFKNTKKRSQK